jgi:hypothetical protein
VSPGGARLTGALIRPGVALTVLLLAPAPGPLRAQVRDRGLELGGLVEAISTDPVWAGGGLSAAYRSGGGTRVVLDAMPGRRGGRTLMRVELLAQFGLTPGREHGVGIYGLGGAAGLFGPGRQGYLVVGLGLEQAPAARSGWFLEAGVGGGVRVALGWRWRRLGSGARP